MMKIQNGINQPQTLQIKPDIKRILKYDTLYKKIRNEKQQHLLWFFIFLAISIPLWILNHPFWVVSLGILSLFHLVWYIGMQRNTPLIPYETGVLVPSKIINLEPLEIMVVSEMQTPSQESKCWGLKRFIMKDLPGHTLKIGERIPCVALLGAALPNGLRSSIEPHPLCWAVDDDSVLKNSITDIEETQWQILDTLLPQVLEQTNPKKNNGYTFFNEDLSKRVKLYSGIIRKTQENNSKKT